MPETSEIHISDTERGMGSVVAARSARHSPWHMDGRLPVSGVEGPSQEIAASRRQKQKTRPTYGSFSTTNKVVQVVEVTSPERVAKNLIWTVGLSLSRARAPNSRNRQPTIHVSRRLARRSRANKEAHSLFSAERWSQRTPPRSHVGAHTIKRAMSVCSYFFASISRCRLLSPDRKLCFCRLRVKVARSRRQI